MGTATDKNIVAKAEVNIDAPIDEVWRALVTPAVIRRYMFGARVEGSFQEGSRVSWQGELDGRPYKDTGRVLRAVPRVLLQYTHISGPTGAQHTVTIDLSIVRGRTRVSLSQDGNRSKEAAAHAERAWRTMLSSLKDVVEAGRQDAAVSTSVLGTAD